MTIKHNLKGYKMLNILQDSTDRLATTGSKTLDVLDNTLELVNNELRSYMVDQEITLKIKGTDKYKSKKEELILAEIDEDISRSLERVSKRKSKRQQKDATDEN